MIAERNRVTCEGCGDEIDAAALGVAQYVSGWSVNRPKGTNAVACQQRHPRWSCQHCLDKMRAGIGVAQTELF